MSDVRYITLSQGKVAVVDAADFDFLSQWKWSAMRTRRAGTVRFYAVRMEQNEGKQRMILMHRQISGAPKGKVVDHRDNDGLNNRRKNIRVCTQGQNSLNRLPNQTDRRSSRFKGVFWHKGGKKWMASFRGEYLGLFVSDEEAAAAYDRAAYTYSPEFALLNCNMAGG